MKKEKKSFKIYVFGNPSVKEDSLPLRLLPRLKTILPNIEFVEIDPTENLPEEEHFVVIDTIINSDEVKVLKDIDKIEFQPNYSLHDFDLGFSLKLMKKLGKIKDVTVIGVPNDTGEEKVLEEVKEAIIKISLKH